MTLLRRSQTSGVILAGGRSQRMGRDKRHLEIDGRPLLLHVVAAIRPIVDELHLVGRDESDRAVLHKILEGHGYWSSPKPLARVNVTSDIRPGLGPLAGIEAGLIAANNEVTLVVAGDHPGLVPVVLTLLIDRLAEDEKLDAVVLRSEYGREPLVAAYRRSALGRLSGLLDRGERRVGAWLEMLKVAELEPNRWHQHDPSGWTAIDLDVEEDVTSWNRPNDATS